MFSLTYTGTCWHSLCTAIVKPTNQGRIVERRTNVLTGRLSFVARTASIFLEQITDPRKDLFNGTCHAPLPFVSNSDDVHNHAGCTLVSTECDTLGRVNSPRTDGIPASRSLTLATTMRVINGFITTPRTVWADAAPACAAPALPMDRQIVLFMPHLTDSCTTIDVHLANLTRTKTQLGVKHLRAPATGTDVPAERVSQHLARHHFNTVNRRADRILRNGKNYPP